VVDYGISVISPCYERTKKEEEKNREREREREREKVL
jgi:hypothetical protein